MQRLPLSCLTLRREVFVWYVLFSERPLETGVRLIIFISLGSFYRQPSRSKRIVGFSIISKKGDLYERYYERVYYRRSIVTFYVYSGYNGHRCPSKKRGKSLEIRTKGKYRKTGSSRTNVRTGYAIGENRFASPLKN